MPGLAPLLAALSIAAAPQQADGAAERIIVLPIVVNGDVRAQNVAMLDEVYLTELGKVVPATVRLVGASDVTTMLDAEQRRQLAGCDDSSCLVEAGHALGAQTVIVTNLGMVEGRYLLSTKLVVLQDALVRHRNTLYLGTSEAELIDGLRRLALGMALDLGWSRGNTSGVMNNPWWWIGGGAAAIGVVALLGGGIVAIAMANVASDGQQSWENKRNAGNAGIGGLLGAGVGALLALGGTTAVVAAWSSAP